MDLSNEANRMKSLKAEADMSDAPGLNGIGLQDPPPLAPEEKRVWDRIIKNRDHEEVVRLLTSASDNIRVHFERTTPRRLARAALADNTSKAYVHSILALGDAIKRELKIDSVAEDLMLQGALMALTRGHAYQTWITAIIDRGMDLQNAELLATFQRLSDQSFRSFEMTITTLRRIKRVDGFFNVKDSQINIAQYQQVQNKNPDGPGPK